MPQSVTNENIEFDLYNIGDTKGYSFYSENTEKYVIVTNYKNKIYMSSYTDEESLKVLNTIQFK